MRARLSSLWMQRRALWRDVSGVSAMEFALILPVLLTLIVATSEFGRLLLISQKLQNGTFIVADLAARDETLTAAQLDNMFLAFNNLIEPFEFGDTGTAIVTSMTADGDGDPVINWQRSGAGTLAEDSDFGLPGEIASIPDTLDLAPGETLIAAEVHFQYSPIFAVSGDGRTLSKFAYVRPRLGSLGVLE